MNRTHRLLLKKVLWFKKGLEIGDYTSTLMGCFISFVRSAPNSLSFAPVNTLLPGYAFFLHFPHTAQQFGTGLCVWSSSCVFLRGQLLSAVILASHISYLHYHHKPVDCRKDMDGHKPCCLCMCLLQSWGWRRFETKAKTLPPRLGGLGALPIQSKPTLQLLAWPMKKTRPLSEICTAVLFPDQFSSLMYSH